MKAFTELTHHPAIHELNSVCFKKCITGRMSQGTLTGGEDTCMKNCVDRYMDANMMIIKNLEKMRM
jgi:import inner membrane translocase subunit TIM8